MTRTCAFLCVAAALSLAGPSPIRGQTTEVAESSGAPGRVIMEPTDARVPSHADRVTLTAQNASMTQVLSAFSLQTGRSVVIGPNVTGTVNFRLRDVPWEAALDVILKPYGYGYRKFGDTIVVNTMAEIQEVETVEPLLSRVFTLRYLDAADVRDIVQTQLSPRGHVSVLAMRGQSGWEFASGSSGRSSRQSGSESDKRSRLQDGAEQQMKSKTIIVMDVPSVIERVARMIEQVDQRPAQILIEARFVEVDESALRDVGIDFGTGAGGAVTPGITPVPVASGGKLYGVGVQSQDGTVSPAAFDARSAGVAATQPFNAGLSLMFQQLSEYQFQVLLHLLAEKVSATILSAPRILTLNNQEATIIAGTKFPIISSDTSGINATTSTSLEYYENIGIQLNVVPQVCDGGFINMIVHPAVSDQIGTAAARTQTDQNIPLTEYPILSTREAETQILLKSGQTVVIGGLLEKREKQSKLKVPLLGDIPVLGRLFTRDTSSQSTFDLLIFLTATIVQEGAGNPAELAGLPTEAPAVSASVDAVIERLRQAGTTGDGAAAQHAARQKAAEDRAALRKQADAQAAAERAAEKAEAKKLADEKAAAKQRATEQAAATKAAAKKQAAEQRRADRLAAEQAAQEAAAAKRRAAEQRRAERLAAEQAAEEAEAAKRLAAAQATAEAVVVQRDEAETPAEAKTSATVSPVEATVATPAATSTAGSPEATEAVAPPRPQFVSPVNIVIR